jgi:hypothetical protein
MNEEEFYLALVKFVTKAILDHTKNQSEALKFITIGVNSVLKAQNKKEKRFDSSKL